MRKIVIIFLSQVFGAKKKHLIETVLYIRFGWEKNYALLYGYVL